MPQSQIHVQVVYCECAQVDTWGNEGGRVGQRLTIGQCLTKVSPAEVLPQPDSLEDSGLYMAPQSCPTLGWGGWPFLCCIIQPLAAGHSSWAFLTKGNSWERGTAVHCYKHHCALENWCTSLWSGPEHVPPALLQMLRSFLKQHSSSQFKWRSPRS